eukprot:jgi/Tetstr1/443268/TSEL_031302.t1
MLRAKKQYGWRWRRLRRRTSIWTTRQTSDKTRCKQRRPPPSSGAAGANEWVSNAKPEVARILVVVCGSSQGQAPSFRSECGVLSDLVALSGEAYKAVVEVQVE